MSKIWVISDTHFNHYNICNYSGRPFLLDREPGEPDYDYKKRVVAHMNASMIAQWQKVVGDEDHVFHLGDFGFVNSYGSPLPEIFAQLPGWKHLIWGNHDYQYEKDIAFLGWVWTKDYHEIRLSKEKRAVLCHYPIESWNRAHRGQIHIHGHCHGTLKRVIPHRYDAGVDAHGKHHSYGPIPLDYFFALAETEEFESQDHHEE
jgi:calcineurin-like phosphoesterase family protein